MDRNILVPLQLYVGTCTLSFQKYLRKFAFYGFIVPVSQMFVGTEAMCSHVHPNQIPKEHLEGLYLWNATHPEPIREVLPPGPGLADTDFVFYVRSFATNPCTAGVGIDKLVTVCGWQGILYHVD